MALVTFAPHTKQWEVYQDNIHDVILAIAGKRGGKSSVAAVKFISNITRNLEKGVYGDYLILGPTYALLRNGTIPTLMRYWPRKLGVYHRSESRIELPKDDDGNPHYIFILSADEPDRIEAFGIIGAWLDEAGQFRQEVWDKVNQRLTTPLGTRVGQIIISTTPYGVPTSWLNKDLIERRVELPWVGYYNWSTLDNPFIDHTNVERLKLTMNPQVFLRDIGGVYTTIEGLIYADFNRQEDVIKPFKIPEGWPIFAGIDYGFTDPTVILILAKDPEQKIFYVIAELYKAKGSLKDFEDFLEEWRGKVKQILYDPSAVGIMTELQRIMRMNLVAADNTVETGIARVTRLFKSSRLKIFNTCQETARELESYVYAEGKNKPEHENSHAPEALRYAFSKDLLGIYPELKRPEKMEEFEKCFSEDGKTFTPPKMTIEQTLDVKKKKIDKKAKDPGEAFEYKPKYDPWVNLEDW